MCDIDGCYTGPDLPPIELDPKDRRNFIKGIVALPLATILFHPELAAAQASKLETVKITTDMGHKVSATIAMPDKLPAPTVLLIHEWWGLNDSIKTMAAEYAKQGFIALAVDLYDGGVATDRDGAKALMSAVDEKVATDTLSSWVAWLKDHEFATGKVATVGWCFGGGWSLNASVATDVDATVIYYGRVTKSPDNLKNLKGPVLGHFGTLDKFINTKMVGGFEANMETAGKADHLTVHWYTANHAFANPTGARYDADDAELAMTRSLSFLHKNLM